MYRIHYGGLWILRGRDLWLCSCVPPFKGERLECTAESSIASSICCPPRLLSFASSFVGVRILDQDAVREAMPLLCGPAGRRRVEKREGRCSALAARGCVRAERVVDWSASLVQGVAIKEAEGVVRPRLSPNDY